MPPVSKPTGQKAAAAKPSSTSTAPVKAEAPKEPTPGPTPPAPPKATPPPAPEPQVSEELDDLPERTELPDEPDTPQVEVSVDQNHDASQDKPESTVDQSVTPEYWVWSLPDGLPDGIYDLPRFGEVVDGRVVEVTGEADQVAARQSPSFKKSSRKAFEEQSDMQIERDKRTQIHEED